MPDREKVIKGLYEAVRIINDHVPVRYVGYAEQACWDALTLLREQETVEPVVHCKDANLSNGADFACSGCGGSFLHKVVNFCPWCGKAVKWE